MKKVTSSRTHSIARTQAFITHFCVSWLNPPPSQPQIRSGLIGHTGTLPRHIIGRCSVCQATKLAQRPELPSLPGLHGVGQL